uniref:Zinc finger GRF-type domain-containing protein n=1 Tax=Tanacetum cinerariifolium TaxID=118510 RepID=A0A6L2LAE7_TANCI|nr:hypothetical protein [Tanacetum cinerariifolium]
MPEQVGVGEFSSPYYISQLRDSLIISGSFGFGNFRIIYAWDLGFEDGIISSCNLLFTIPHPAVHFLKLLGFSIANEPIVEAETVQQWYSLLQVFHPTIEGFVNIHVEANHYIAIMKMAPYEAFACRCGKGDVVLRESYQPYTSGKFYYACPRSKPKENDYGCKFVYGKRNEPVYYLVLRDLHRLQVIPQKLHHLIAIPQEERVRLLLSSSGSSSTTSYSLEASSPNSYSLGSTTPQNHQSGTSISEGCSNCKHLLVKIKVLKAAIEMHMHPKQHTRNSPAPLHELYNDMDNLGLE